MLHNSESQRFARKTCLKRIITGAGIDCWLLYLLNISTCQCLANPRCKNLRKTESIFLRNSGHDRYRYRSFAPAYTLSLASRCHHRLLIKACDKRRAPFSRGPRIRWLARVAAVTFISFVNIYTVVPRLLSTPTKARITTLFGYFAILVPSFSEKPKLASRITEAGRKRYIERVVDETNFC